MKFMLVDGHSLTYRAFFALPTDLSTASGQVTNAVYGFTSMLLNLIRDHRPDAVAVAFDRPEPTFRHEAVEDYKANRTEAPDILRQQLGLVRELVETLEIPIFELAGVEADDILATLAEQVKSRGDDVLIVTGDRDSYQLVDDPHVKVLYNKRGVSDYALYDEAGIQERTGVHPRDYVTYAALRGDKSDNLPGVPGVGEKTAARLVNKYGDIDGIYAALDDQTPKLRENLAAHEERVRKNLEVMDLLRHVELDVDLDDLGMPHPDPEAVRTLFDFLEFHSMVGRLEEAFGDAMAETSAEMSVVEADLSELTTTDEVIDLCTRLGGVDGPVALACGLDGGDRVTGVALVVDADAGQVSWIPRRLLDDDTALADDAAMESVRALLAVKPVAIHEAKPALKALGLLGIDLLLGIDTMLAAYLLDPAEARYDLDDILRRYVHRELPAGEATPDGQLALDPDPVDGGLSAGREALAVALLVGPLQEALAAHGLQSLNDDIEVPLVGVLARMEVLGIGVDVEELEALNDRLGRESSELTAAIWEDAGQEFKINSTPQLREILFDKLGLTPQKKTKTGYSTDAASLEKLRGDHPIVDHLLRYREVEKLRSTYAEGLLAEVGPDRRIHATFNQTVARTGRLSSDRPNLHNIPVRTEEGRGFRRAFVPGDGFEFLVADYNQIELRCIAHLAEDPGLIAAFDAGTDIHTETAARIFGVDVDEVTTGQRSKAKMVSYGLAYGMEAYGLGQRLGVPTTDAQAILDSYFEAFPAVRDYMDATVAEARERGYTETLFGRRRQIPELSSGNFRIRQAGERQAMNAGIQGLAADIFKVALIRLDAELTRIASPARLILQVHDEVILEVPPDLLGDLSRLTVDILRGAYDLRVPLDVNLSTGASWADAKQ